MASLPGRKTIVGDGSWLPPPSQPARGFSVTGPETFGTSIVTAAVRSRIRTPDSRFRIPSVWLRCQPYTIAGFASGLISPQSPAFGEVVVNQNVQFPSLEDREC
jgi:hypothetical protein